MQSLSATLPCAAPSCGWPKTCWPRFGTSPSINRRPNTPQQWARSCNNLAAGGQTRRTSFTSAEIATAALDAAAAAYQNHGRHPDAIPTGLKALDDLLGGLGRGKLIVAGGRPGMGKSALGLALAFNAARAGVPALILSIEMTDVELGHRLLSMVSDVPYSRTQAGRFGEADYGKLVAARDMIAGLPLTIDVRDSMAAAEAGAIIARHSSLGLVVVNYISLLSPGDRYRGNKVNEVGEITGELKRCAKRHKVAVLAWRSRN